MLHDPERVIALMDGDCKGAILDNFLNAQKQRVVSIYRVPKDGPETAIEHCGSGFLFFHKGRHFVVSAAHVWDNTERFELGAYRKKGGQTESHVFRGTKFTTLLPLTGRDDDILDIGAIPLTDDEVTFFGSANFYTVNDCALREPCRITSLYSCIGYPNTKNEPNLYLNRRNSQPYSYSNNGATEDRFKALNITERTHVVLDLDPKRVVFRSGGVQTPPSRKGMSGGPVFRFHDYASPYAALQQRDPKLVAILIENPKFERSTVLVATNIAFVLICMSRAFNQPANAPRNPPPTQDQ